ncbi:MAG: hypothetical protein PUE59_11110 [Treponema sp.]|nr:hypothetical protein [Treponema sp.]MDD6655561.1 hypothetical protein [Treponema sp.]
MEFKVILSIENSTIAKLSEESESNESNFVRKIFTDILKQIAIKTKEIYEDAKKINLENPYGYPDL